MNNESVQTIKNNQNQSFVLIIPKEYLNSNSETKRRLDEAKLSSDIKPQTFIKSFKITIE